MSTLNGSKRQCGRRAGGALLLLAAGALAAGCGAASSSGTAGTPPGSPAPGSTGSGSAGTSSSPSGGAATSGPVSGPSTPVAASTPVPTVSGKVVAPGEVHCSGWPSGAPTGSLPVSFVPVTVERCVSSAQTIPGQGFWATATLERADSGLTGLVTALREPSATHHSGACPAIAMIPPAVVLISAGGQQLIPKLPVGGCGLVASQVTLALNGLHWTPVSVTLVSRISSGPVPSASEPTVSGSPRGLQTVGATP